MKFSIRLFFVPKNCLNSSFRTLASEIIVSQSHCVEVIAFEVPLVSPRTNTMYYYDRRFGFRRNATQYDARSNWL